MTATLKQGKKIAEIFEDLSVARLQAIIASRLLMDLRDVSDIAKVNRDEVRHSLGLPPLAPVGSSAPAPSPCWRVGEDDIIYFSVISNGTTGEEWIACLKAKGYNVSPYAESVLRSDDFEPTNGIVTEVAVLSGSLWSDNNRTTKNIRAGAKKRKFRKLNAEVACLIREQFTDEELAKMGLWWLIVMHNPIEDSDGAPFLLGVNRYDDGRWLSACNDTPLDRWNRDYAFAFAVPAK